MMAAMRVVVAVSLLVSASALAGPEVPIVGGTQATQGEFPNVVGLVYDHGDGTLFVCTGTLITPTWVMTAGHCVIPSEVGATGQDDVTTSLRVYVNALTIVPVPSGNDGLQATTTIPDPAFDLNFLGSHDMGLVQLAQPVVGVTPVRLNFDASAAQPGLAVTQVGYGLTVDDDSTTIGTMNTVTQTLASCAWSRQPTSTLWTLTCCAGARPAARGSARATPADRRSRRSAARLSRSARPRSLIRPALSTAPTPGSMPSGSSCSRTSRCAARTRIASRSRSASNSSASRCRTHRWDSARHAAPPPTATPATAS